MTLLHLCQVYHLDKNYENVVDFKSESSRRSWFLNRCKLTTEWQGKADVNRDNIIINVSLDDIRDCDYLFYQTVDGKAAFYFIDKVEHNTTSSCNVSITLDVFTTYCLDFTLQHSLVERCHVDRWESVGIPTLEIVDEGTALIEQVVVSKEMLMKEDGQPASKDGGILYCSANPLGQIDNSYNGGSEETEPVPSGMVRDEFGNLWLIPTTSHNGRLTAGYPYYSNGDYHGGWDIPNVEGTPITSASVGKVVRISDTGAKDYGKSIWIKTNKTANGKGLLMLYAHLSVINPDLAVGDFVAEGSLLGFMGSTGNSTGNHLHWEGRLVDMNNDNDFGYCKADYNFNLATNWKPYGKLEVIE